MYPECQYIYDVLEAGRDMAIKNKLPLMAIAMSNGMAEINKIDKHFKAVEKQVERLEKINELEKAVRIHNVGDSQL